MAFDKLKAQSLLNRSCKLSDRIKPHGITPAELRNLTDQELMELAEKIMSHDEYLDFVRLRRKARTMSATELVKLIRRTVKA